MAAALKRPSLWLFVLALAARLAVIVVARFDGLYGQDAFAYFDYAGQIVRTSPGVALAGPIYWPLGYPALAALLFRLFGASALSAQLASIGAGAAVAPLVYELVLQLAAIVPLGEAGGAVRLAAVGAGLITALSGQLLQSSIVIMADAPGVFWAALAAFWLLRFDRKRAAIWLLPAAVALALAIITRWIFAGLVVPFGAYLLLTFRARQLEATTPRAPAWHRLVPAVASGALFLVVLLPQVAFSQSSAAPVFSHGWVVGWNPANALRTSFDNPDGHFDYRLPPIVYYAEPLFHPFYLFPVFTPLVLLGAWRLRRSRTLVLIGGWLLTLYVYLCGVPYENFRFGLAYFPPVVCLVGVGLTVVMANLSRSALNRLSVIFALALAASAPFIYRGLAAFLSIKTGELAATRYLSAAIPARANVLTFSLTLTLQHYTDFQVEDISEQSPDTLRRLVCSSSPSYLYVEMQNLESQWVGKTPDQNYHWLLDQPGLKEQGREGTWVLYQVQSHGCAGHVPAQRAVS